MLDEKTRKDLDELEKTVKMFCERTEKRLQAELDDVAKLIAVLKECENGLAN